MKQENSSEGHEWLLIRRCFREKVNRWVYGYEFWVKEVLNDLKTWGLQKNINRIANSEPSRLAASVSG